MPIIFSYRNPGLIPYLRPSITYEIWNYNNFSADSAGGRREVPLANDSSLDQVIEFDSHLYPFNTKEKGRRELDMYDINETNIGGIIFSTRGLFKQVDLIAATSNKNCSFPTGVAINITDTMRTPFPHGEYELDVCPIVASPQIKADSCDVKLDLATALSIDASMTSWVCNRIWETNRPKEVDCDSLKEEESTALRTVAGGTTCLAFVLGVFAYMHNFL
ncbi:uncharacterized protein FTOL_10156 [Fusarium torulosum]|uniref:DUF7136 domain-containing protein n=1 Tax=Fusarium torulosum TaxID=33205 RepID=A0AAE8MFR9_9HYPO|nr:uncharacterized protein FTOL_10156 [Fusarium torulosum]